MKMLDEAARPHTEGLWRHGTLSDEEFERAALLIRPSWEVGLEAAEARTKDDAALAPPADSSSDAKGFHAPSAGVLDALRAAENPSPDDSMLPKTEVIAKAPVEEPKVEAKPAPVVETRAEAKAPVEEKKPAAKPVEARPRPAPAKFIEPPPEVPKTSGGGKWFAIAAGVAVVIGGIAFAMSSGSSSTATTPAPTTAAPEPAPAPAAEPAPAPAPAPAAAPAPEPTPAPAVAAPEPAPAPAPEPTPAPAAAPEPPPAPVVAAPEPPPAPPPAPVAAPEPPPAPAAPVRAAVHVEHRPHRERPAPRPAARPAAPAAAARPAAQSPRGVGFVTESPY